MTRLFDSDAEAKKLQATRTSQAEARRRGEEVEEALRDYEETDAQSKALSASLSKARAGVVPVHYQEHRLPGCKWMIEHSPIGEDYILQCHPIRPPVLVWQDIITMMIAAMDVIFPDSIRIEYVRPNDGYQLKFYTITVRKIAGLPGWKEAIERALAGLSAVDAWPAPKAP
jgi:hypothetical protein